MLEYQRGVPGLDLQKYQTQKVRHYRNRCREMRISPDEGLIEAILDPSVDFVVGVQADDAGYPDVGAGYVRPLQNDGRLR